VFAASLGSDIPLLIGSKTMNVHHVLRIAAIALILTALELVGSPFASGQFSEEEAPPASWRANAALRDVYFFNEQLGWAVGDQGTILRTDDGGLTWTLVPVNTSCSLTSVHFVDEMNGWAAGGQSVSLVDRTHAVILRTRDGGRTWATITGTLLPALRELRMVNAQSGWAWGSPTQHFPSGIFRTEDGGTSWSDFSQADPIGWRAVAALPSGFVVATPDGRLGTYRGGQFRAARQATEHPSIRRLVFFDERHGWALGDGELLQSDDAGASWQPFFLPGDLGKTGRVDFHTAAQVGGRQWLAGSAGNVVYFRDVESGQWSRGQTPIRSAIHRLFFVNRDNGWAVGEGGHILVTRDAGVTWQAQRSGNARVGLLVVCPSAQSIPFELLARNCADRGYLSAVAFAHADSLLGDGEQRAQEACLRQGVSTIVGNLPASGDVQLQRLVDLIRQLQPSVVVVVDSGQPQPSGPTNNQRRTVAPSDLVGAVIDAVAQAADLNAGRGPLGEAELPTWQTPLVYQAQSKSSKSEFGTPEFLPSLGRNLFDQQLVSETLLRRPTIPGTSWELFAVGDPAAIASSALFNGIADGPLAPPRRPEQPPRGHVGQIKSIVGKHATLQQLVTQFDSSPSSLKVWRQRVDQLIGEMPPEIAGSWLWQLSESYCRANQLELAALSRAALLERCGEHPLAWEARLWLASYFASQELSWCEFRQQQRLSEASPTGGDGAVQPAGLRSSPEKIEIDGIAHLVWTVDPPEKGAATDPRAEIRGQLPPSVPTDFRSFAAQRFATARSLLRSIQQGDAELSLDPQFRFAEAHLQRLTEGTIAAESSLRKTSTKYLPADQREAILREIRLTGSMTLDSMEGAIDCPAISEPPFLDGVLDDEVWRSLAQNDQIIRLAAGPTGPAPANEAREMVPRAAADPTLGKTQVLLAHDDEYLYLAAICHRAAPVRDNKSAVRPARRTRDQLGEELDQIHFALDIDRDCRTSYRFSVDGQGAFADQIGDDRLWNPTWYIAHSSTDLNWIVEAAIPLDQLGPAPGIGVDASWGISIRRRLPDGALEGWSLGSSGDDGGSMQTRLTKPEFVPFDGVLVFR
jgi:photosystem II stability/assembly factor-like uncharacterized protein